MASAVPHEPLLDEEVMLIPPYNVILWDSPDHSFEYVIVMMRELFNYTVEKAFEIAKIVDSTGKCIVWSGPLEHAEFHRDRIHAFGSDKNIPRCKGSMHATIEKAL